MRFTALAVCVVGLIALAGALAVGQTPQTPQTRQDAPPTLEQLTTAVARLEAGRIKRPNSYDALTPEQKSYVNGILTGPRAAISGPLSVMMVSPGMGSIVQQAMAYSRFAGTEGFSSVPPKLNEMGILMVARLWTADYVWNAHNRYAVQVGLSPDVVEAIKQGKRPTKMDKDVQVIYDFVDEMLTKRRVSDASFQAARGVLGSDKGVVDLVGTLGLYQISSMLVVVDDLVPANLQGRLPALK
jgi:4-carboxymuconolactone decarboxylase